MTRALRGFNFRDTKNNAVIAVDRRGAPRRRVLKDAVIVLNHGQSTLSCLVTDISESGARLRMPYSSSLPTSFLLRIKNDSVGRPVRRVWSTLREVGVRFLEERAALR